MKDLHPKYMTNSLNSKKTKNAMKIWAKDSNRCLIKEDMQMSNNYMKRQSISYIIR